MATLAIQVVRARAAQECIVTLAAPCAHRHAKGVVGDRVICAAPTELDAGHLGIVPCRAPLDHLHRGGARRIEDRGQGNVRLRVVSADVQHPGVQRDAGHGGSGPRFKLLKTKPPLLVLTVHRRVPCPWFFLSGPGLSRPVPFNAPGGPDSDMEFFQFAKIRVFPRFFLGFHCAQNSLAE